MKKSNNRIVDGLVEWSAKENQLRALFGPKVDLQKEFMRERLNHYLTLQKNFRGNKTLDERITYNVLKGQVKALWKQAYPERISRAFYKAVDFGKKILVAIEKVGAAIDRGLKKLQGNGGKLIIQKPAAVLQKGSPGMTLAQIVARYNDYKKKDQKTTDRISGNTQEVNNKSTNTRSAIKNEPAANGDTKLQPRKMTGKAINADDGPLLSKNRQGTGKNRTI